VVFQEPDYKQPLANSITVSESDTTKMETNMTDNLSSIDSDVLYLAVYAACVAATAVLVGVLLPAIDYLWHKGQPKFDIHGIGDFLLGMGLGGLISLFLTAYLMFTSTLLETFTTTLYICAGLFALDVIVLCLNWLLYGRR
jgi:small-conductance mechanosensitive channel